MKSEMFKVLRTKIVTATFETKITQFYIRRTIAQNKDERKSRNDNEITMFSFALYDE